MTNNPTIDGVSRELLERLLTDACNENWSDLNQLLNAPTACRECMGTGGIGRLETCRYCVGTGKISAPVVKRQPVEVVQMASMPVERCYDVRAKMIIAFNEAKKAGGDLDDQLDAAYKAALRYSPAPQDFADQQSTIAQQAALIASLRSELSESYSIDTAPPAPVVVVLPERQSENEGNSYSVMQAMAWNACLDATAALNGVKS